MDQNRRPSVHLQERAEDLGRVFDYFLAPHRGQSPGPKEMLVVFLSQLEFWEWELDNLIHAFATFKERATAWEHESGVGITNSLRTRGIWVQTNVVKDLKLKRQARSGRAARVFAPVDVLETVIKQWNELLSLCEDRILIPPEERQLALKSGVQLLPNLSKFRKSLPNTDRGAASNP
jgi:hypothetical protein